ncbi:MAG TPA: serine--tRNA ligase, partial [Gemmatimonadaceae bacterium]
MHDLHLLRDNPQAIRDGLSRRRMLESSGALVDHALALEAERRAIIQRVEEIKASRNTVTQAVAQRKRAGEDTESFVAEGRALGDEIDALQMHLTSTEEELSAVVLQIPNVPLADVPSGGEENNVVVRSWGTPRSTDGVIPHWDIGARLGLIDLERGAKVSGSGFIVYR